MGEKTTDNEVNKAFWNVLHEHVDGKMGDKYGHNYNLRSILVCLST